MGLVVTKTVSIKTGYQANPNVETTTTISPVVTVMAVSLAACVVTTVVRSMYKDLHAARRNGSSSSSPD